MHNREVLHAELFKQHEGYIVEYPAVASNIDLLKNSNTFTVTTGHQLCIAGSPLFFIYKIVSAIRLADELNKTYPAYRFVPVYWMATEDHDFEEISAVHTRNGIVTWEKPADGPAGRLPLTNIETVIDALKNSVDGLPYADEFNAIINEAYCNHSTLAEATRSFVMQIFGRFGVVTVDGDTEAFKEQFTAIVEDELLNQTTSVIVNKTIRDFKGRYEPQVNPRDLNLFYITDHSRERIVTNGDGYELIGSSRKFSWEEILQELRSHPERFSPNVLMRPLYQETLLPDVAYIGGPAEIAYWLELKLLFDKHQLPFPVLIPRNHGLLIDDKSLRKFESLGFKSSDLFSDYDKLSLQLIQDSGRTAAVEKVSDALSKMYTGLADDLATDDPGLKGSAMAELQKAVNGLDNLARKHRASLKKKEETRLTQLNTILNKVKPGNVPQERVEGLAFYYAQYGQQLIDQLIQGMHPFSDDVLVLNV